MKGTFDTYLAMGLLGGGLIVYCTIGDTTVRARTLREGFLGSNVPTDFSSFLGIGVANRVTCFVGKKEFCRFEFFQPEAILFPCDPMLMAVYNISPLNVRKAP